MKPTDSAREAFVQAKGHASAARDLAGLAAREDVPDMRQAAAVASIAASLAALTSLLVEDFAQELEADSRG